MRIRVYDVKEVIKGVDSLDVPTGSGEGGREEARRDRRERMEEKERKKGAKGLLSRPDFRVVKEKEDESCSWKGGRSHTCGLGVVSLIRPSKCSLQQRRLCANKHVKKTPTLLSPRKLRVQSPTRGH